MKARSVYLVIVALLAAILAVWFISSPGSNLAGVISAVVAVFLIGLAIAQAKKDKQEHH